MPERVRVDILDWNGETVDSIQDFNALTLNQSIDARGNFQLTLSQFHRSEGSIGEDFLGVVYYEWPEKGVTWREIFTGIFKTEQRQRTTTGRKPLMFRGTDLMELIEKTYILYPSGHAKSSKSAACATAMTEFFIENLGLTAVTTAGRRVDHQNPVTAVTKGGLGPTWSGAKADRPLMQVMQGIRAHSINQSDKVDFRVIHTGDYEFEFQAGSGVYQDRTIGNASGNTEVVLSESRSNLRSFTETKSRINSFNTIIGLGQGKGSERDVHVIQNLESASPIAQRERAVSFVQASSTDALIASTEEDHEDKKPRVRITASPNDSGYVLFKDFDFGDKISIQSDITGEYFTKQLVSLSISVSQTNGQVFEKDLGFSDE